MKFQYRKRYDSARNYKKGSHVSTWVFQYRKRYDSARNNCQSICIGGIFKFQYRKRYDSARNTNMFSTFASTLVCFNTVNGMTVHVTDEKLLFEQGYRCFNTVNGMTVHVTLCLAPLKIPRPMMQNRKTSLIFPFYSIKIS